MNTNDYKTLPFTTEIDWRTGNILLNINSIGCKLSLGDKDIELIQACKKLYISSGGEDPINQGDIFKTETNIVKVLDITSQNFNPSAKEYPDTRFGYIRLEYIEELNEAIFVINDRNDVFLEDIKTHEKIKEKMVIYINLNDKEIVYKAMPYNKFIELYTLDSLISKQI